MFSNGGLQNRADTSLLREQSHPMCRRRVNQEVCYDRV